MKSMRILFAMGTAMVFFAAASNLSSCPFCAKLGRTISDQVADADWVGSGKVALDGLSFELESLVKAPPAGTTWVHEMKYDGYRMLCRIDHREAQIVSRNGKEWTDDFPAIAKALAKLPVGTAWIDGEICVVDAQGRSSFQALQNVLSTGLGSPLYLAFHLLYADGIDPRYQHSG